MKVRTKLLLGYAGFVLALGLLGSWSARTLSQMSAVSGRIIAENYDSVRKADDASRIARRWCFITLALAFGLMVVGIAVEMSLSNAILGPVRQLTAATTRVAAGELETAVPVRSGDEIGTLASGFNRMAERIRELRRSDMGQLLVAQQTTEAAIDSLFDPVIVADGKGLVTRINPAAERLFGVRADTLGKSIETVTRDPRIAQSVADVLHAVRDISREDLDVAARWEEG